MKVREEIVEVAKRVGEAIKEIESITGKSVRVFRYGPIEDESAEPLFHVAFSDGKPISPLE